MNRASSSSKLTKTFGQTEFLFDQDIHDARILIIDDDPLNVEVLKEILAEDQYQHVTAVTQPQEAVERYLNECFDLILLDILMPGMDGFEVMEAFKQKRPEAQVPIIILSALTDQDTRLKALNSGARDYISKPFNTAEVLVRIHNQLEIRLAQKQLAQHNEILDQKVRERTAELQETRLEIIHRLGMAAEYRDNETGLHIVRMDSLPRPFERARPTPASDVDRRRRTACPSMARESVRCNEIRRSMRDRAGRASRGCRAGRVGPASGHGRDSRRPARLPPTGDWWITLRGCRVCPRAASAGRRFTSSC